VTWDDAVEDTALYDGFIGAAVAEAIAPNAAWYCWHASRRQAMLESMWVKHGAFVHAQIIWAKNRGVLTRTWYAWQHEPCLFGWIVGKKPPRRSNTYLSTVWQIPTIPNGDERPEHPTPKPLDVFTIPMDQHTRPGEICYEPFAGSGSQLIAAEKLGRRCFGIEISPTYCDLIIRRYIAFAGEGAVDPAIAKKYRLTDRVSSAASTKQVARGAAQIVETKPTASTDSESKRASKSSSKFRPTPRSTSPSTPQPTPQSKPTSKPRKKATPKPVAKPRQAVTTKPAAGRNAKPASRTPPRKGAANGEANPATRPRPREAGRAEEEGKERRSPRTPPTPTRLASLIPRPSANQSGRSSPSSGTCAKGACRASMLHRDDRLRVVEHLTAEGYTGPEIAEVLKVSERTVIRDRIAVREMNALLPSPELVGQVVGHMVRTAEQVTGRLRRIGREAGIKPAEKIEAEKVSWQIQRELVVTLQGLGYLPTAPTNLNAHITTGDELPQAETLLAEIDRLESLPELRAADGTPIVSPELSELRGMLTRSIVTQRLGSRGRDGESDSHAHSSGGVDADAAEGDRP
jgi:hypothetical protein